MSTFILAVSCLTTSNLPRFTDLKFQFIMQYCSLQNQTFFSSPDTSTTEHSFLFGPDTSVFLELLVMALHSSLVTYRTPSIFGDSPPSITIFCLFIPPLWFSKQEYWGGLPFSPHPHGSRFVRALHCDPAVLHGSTWHG